mmetsp:Transcript_191/g.486  ORF Transcript_191/g.486 Transcript_191/m.486 type:complete len:235 (+) Transcript_191:43-747(+)
MILCGGGGCHRYQPTYSIHVLLLAAPKISVIIIITITTHKVRKHLVHSLFRIARIQKSPMLPLPLADEHGTRHALAHVRLHLRAWHNRILAAHEHERAGVAGTFVPQLRSIRVEQQLCEVRLPAHDKLVAEIRANQQALVRILKAPLSHLRQAPRERALQALQLVAPKEAHPLRESCGKCNRVDESPPPDESLWRDAVQRRRNAGSPAVCDEVHAVRHARRGERLLGKHVAACG